jgi:hypothetical protein
MTLLLQTYYPLAFCFVFWKLADLRLILYSLTFLVRYGCQNTYRQKAHEAFQVSGFYTSINSAATNIYLSNVGATNRIVTMV